ncbi:MAG: hypothetical protein M1829_001385 [Trizodia sp. TS-e1964]|nr:MAG: hypothetical protein M1829_001385 [Trizodia sp. TS-e1964]
MQFTTIAAIVFAVYVASAAPLTDEALGNSHPVTNTKATAFSEHLRPMTLRPRANIIERQNSFSPEYLASLNPKKIFNLHHTLQAAYARDIKVLQNPNDEMERRAKVALSILSYATPFKSLQPFEAQSLYLYLEALRAEMLVRNPAFFFGFPALFGVLDNGTI